MGDISARLLHKLAMGKKLQSDFEATNLASYTLIPLKLPELTLNQNLIGNAKWVGYACFAVVVLSASTCAMWTTLKWKTCVVVQAAQPFFLIMVAGGVLIMSGALIPLSFEVSGVDYIEMMLEDSRKSVGMCMSVPWLAFIGFTVTFSGLFSKTWRVNRLFHSRAGRHARIQVSEREVLAPFASLLISNIIVLTCWTVHDPLIYVRRDHEGTDYWNRVISTYGACRSKNGAVAYLVPLAVINISVVCIAAWQAFQARDIEAEFSEAVRWRMRPKLILYLRFTLPGPHLEFVLFIFLSLLSDLHWPCSVLRYASILDRDPRCYRCNEHAYGVLPGAQHYDLPSLYGGASRNLPPEVFYEPKIRKHDGIRT